MRPRKWVVFFGAALILLAVAAWQAVLFLERERNIENLLIERITPLVGGSFDVQRVRLGFLSAYLHGVELVLPINALTIRVTDIKIGFSLWKLLQFSGDIGRSITKVILIQPSIEISLAPDSTSMRAGTPQGLASLPVAGAFPVEHLFIDRGQVTVIDDQGDRFVFGEDLAGRIRQESGGTGFELRGKVASHRRNLSVSGSFSNGTDRGRISVRLDRARVSRPVVWRSVAITGGILDGVGEFFFGDTISPRALESRGWFTIEAGQCSVDAVSEPIEDIDLRLTLSGAGVIIDSLSGTWRGMRGKGSGHWDIAGSESSAVALRIEGIQPSRLRENVPQFVKENLLGDGWIGLVVVKAPHTRELSGRITAGGMSLLGLPITHAAGSVHLAGETVRIDSLAVATPGVRIEVSGRIGVGSPAPAYDLGFGIRGDSLPSLPAIKGSYRIQGDVEGKGVDATIRARMIGRNFFLFGVPLGNPEVQLTKKGDLVTISPAASGSDVFSATGSLEGLGGGKPSVDMVLKLGSAPLVEFMRQVQPGAASRIRSAQAEIHLEGEIARPAATVSLELDAPPLTGSAVLSLHGDTKVAERIQWRISRDELSMRDTAFPLRACGSYHRDTLAVDTLSLMNGLSGEGRITLGKRTDIDLHLSFAQVMVGSLGRWFLGKESALRAGSVAGKSRITGPADRIVTSSEIHLRNCIVGDFDHLSMDAIVLTRGEKATILPMVVRKDGKAVLMLDTVSNDGGIRLSGQFQDVDLRGILGAAVPEGIGGRVSGTLRASPRGWPVSITAQSRRIEIDQWGLDSVRLDLSLDSTGIWIREFRASDSTRVAASGTARIPYGFLSSAVGELDTLRASVHIAGDLLASVQRNIDSPVGGRGRGEVRASIVATADSWRVVEGVLKIPQGNLLFEPFILKRRPETSCSLYVDDSARVRGEIRCAVGRRAIRITSSHRIPKGYEPIMVGPLNFGIIFVETPDGPVELHWPGFMKIGELGKVEVAGRGPFNRFALSGPLDRMKITGTCIVKDVEFTFPTLTEEKLPWEFDPFPFITWELDVKFGNKAVYYWALRGKRRELVRFFEGSLDRSTSWIGLRGREQDRTFQLLGAMRSYRGVAYFGKAFDRNVDVGIEFSPRSYGPGKGYDNYPVIWGSAETFSDTSRFNRVKLTMRVQDPITGSVSEKGRVALVPATRSSRRRDDPDDLRDSLPNFVFHVSSDFDGIPGDAEREFFQEAGLRFANFETAGEFVSDFGEQYLHRYLFQRVERTLAKRLGLDVITFETSIASNYFYYLYNRQFEELGNQWNLLANMGLTVGRYFFRDNLFLKARGELVSADTLLRPEYSLGLEFMPANYFMMDINYGFYRGETEIEHNPKIQMQLRLPIRRIRTLFDF